MKKEDMEEKKKKVINDFINTRKHIKIIAKENNISLNEVYAILEEYNTSNELKRPGNITFSANQKDETDEVVTQLYEKIYNLREKRYGYTRIVEQLRLEGIKISPPTVKQICNEIYVTKCEKEPETKNTTSKRKIDENQYINERIFELRERLLSNEAIAQELNKEGIKICWQTVRKRCNEMYDSKGKVKPILSRISKESKELNEKIYALKEQGLTYRKISEHLAEDGTFLSRQAIDQRYKKTLGLKEKQLAKAILKLITTKKATLEQVKIIADYYGVDLEKTMNSLEEPADSSEDREI